MRWVGTKHISTSDESWAVSWERRPSQYVQSYSFPNILLDGWEALKAYFFDKKQSKGAHFEKIFRRAQRGEITSHFFFAALRAVQHGLYTSNLLPTPMQWYTKTPAKNPTISEIVPVTTAVIPKAAPVLKDYTAPVTKSEE